MTALSRREFGAAVVGGLALGSEVAATSSDPFKKTHPTFVRLDADADSDSQRIILDADEITQVGLNSPVTVPAVIANLAVQHIHLARHCGRVVVKVKDAAGIESVIFDSGSYPVMPYKRAQHIARNAWGPGNESRVDRKVHKELAAQWVRDCAKESPTMRATLRHMKEEGSATMMLTTDLPMPAESSLASQLYWFNFLQPRPELLVYVKGQYEGHVVWNEPNLRQLLLRVGSGKDGRPQHYVGLRSETVLLLELKRQTA